MDYYDDYTGDGAIVMDDWGDCPAPGADYPAYLRDVPAGGRTYGTLSYNRKSKCWTIKGEPCVTELAKRLFPGCDGRGRGVARFTAHRRIIGELNWLMLRYPLEVKPSDRTRWESALEDAREYALRRERSLSMPETATPPSPGRWTPRALNTSTSTASGRAAASIFAWGAWASRSRRAARRRRGCANSCGATWSRTRWTA